MAFLGDFGKKISQAGQSTLQKTKEMADVAKINMQISDEEKNINNYFLEIGKLYTEIHESDSEDVFKEMVQNILAARDKIKEYQAQIQDIKGVLRCTNCGAEVGKGVQFCPACGSKITEIQTEEKESAGEEPAGEAAAEKRKCVNCGADLQEDALFCSECGMKVE